MRSRMANRWVLDEVDAAQADLRNSNNFDNYLNQTCCTKKVIYKYDPFPYNISTEEFIVLYMIFLSQIDENDGLGRKELLQLLLLIIDVNCF